MKTFSLSIQNSLLIALATLSGFVLISTFVGWLAFDRVRTIQQNLLTESLPTLRLIDQTGDNVTKLLTINDDLQRSLSSVELREVETRAYPLLRQIESDFLVFSNGTNSQLLDSLKNNSLTLKNNIETQLELQNDIVTLTQQIAIESDELLDVIAKVTIVIKIITSELSLTLTQASGEQQAATNFQLSSLNELRFNISGMERIIRQTESLNDYATIENEESLFRLQIKILVSKFLDIEKEYRSRLASDINTLNTNFLKEDNIFSLWKKRALQNQKINDLEQQNNKTNEVIGEFFSTISTNANNTLDNKANEILTTIIRSKLILAITAAAALLTVIIFYLSFIRPKIINRLVRLTENTQDIANGNHNININTDGSDEISTMAKTLHFFRDQLLEKNTIQTSLIDREKRMSAIIENATDSLLIVDSEGNIESCNPASEIIFNGTERLLIGNKIVNFLPKERTLFNSHLNFSGSDKDGHTICKGKEVEGLKLSGENFYCSLSISLIDLFGKKIYSCIIRDITEDKTTQEALKESEERYAVSIEGSAVGLWDFNISSGDLFWSDRFKTILNISDDDLTGTIADFNDRLHPDDNERILNALNNHIENKQVYDVEYRLQHEDGSYIWVHARGQALWDESGRPLRMAGSVDDISEKKQAEKEREEIIEKLVNSNADLERFAYSCSHDLQEPVRMVMSFSELLDKHASATLDEKGKKYLSHIIDGAHNAKALIKDILKYSRLDHSTIDQEWTTFDSLCKQVNNITLLSQEEKKATITWQGNDVSLHVIVPQILQLLTNLVTNGLKYNQNKAPLITLSAVEEENDWLLCVEDNGIGIDSRYHERIFGVFNRLVSRREYAGSGIGLSICKKVAANHSGRIWVESAVGKGSRFYVSLPKNMKNQTNA